MTVDVIIPAYNAEGTIRQCVESVLAQGYHDLNVMIVNDGSTDNTSGAIARAERVSVSHTTHNGVSSARNTGIEVSAGEFIMFVDADDYLEPGAIQKLVEAMDGVDMVAGSFHKFGDFEMTVQHETKLMGLPEIADYVMGNLRNPRTNQMLSGCWAKLFKRELVGRFPDLTTAEDMAFVFAYLRLCNSARFISDIVYHNRKHSGTLTTTFDETNKAGLFGFLEGLRYVERFLSEFYYKEELTPALDNSKVYHSMLYAQRIGPDALQKLFP